MSETTSQAPFSLPEAVIEKIDRLVPRYPQKRSAVLPLLQFVQNEHGWVSDAAVEWIANRLELEPIHVYEVVTFYPMFRRKPGGRHRIKVCRTLSCMLNGGYEVCEAFRREFGVGLDEPTPDGEVLVEYVECLASCGTAPVVQVNDTLYENVTPEKVGELAEAIRAAARSSQGSQP